MELDEVKQKMVKVVEFTRGDIGSIRTGRANPTLIENIIIGAYGNTTRMRVVELATITAPEPQSLVVAPYDQSIIGDIRRDIEAANIGLQPVIDNNLIRINFPPLTAERRLEFVKLLHHKLEDGRVKIRQVRHDKMSELKRDFEEGNLNEDDRKRLETQLQEMTDKFMTELEALGKDKESELMTV